MSKRNRENRARKQKTKAAKRPKSNIPMPPAGFFGDGPDAILGRKRLAMMMPIMWLAKKNPYKPGMELPAGSIIAGEEHKGYVPGDVVPQLIAETQRELGVEFDEIIDTLVHFVEHGALEIVQPAAKIATLERDLRELFGATVRSTEASAERAS